MLEMLPIGSATMSEPPVPSLEGAHPERRTSRDRGTHREICDRLVWVR